MALWNKTKRPVKFSNGTDASPPKAGYFFLKIVITSGSATHNGEDLPDGSVVELEAPEGRTLPVPNIEGTCTYSWHGMR